MSDETYVLIAIKRDWVPDWLFSLLAPVAGCWPLKRILMRPVDELTDRRINGGNR